VEVEAELVHFDHARPHLHPDLQRWVSKRMGATVVEVEISHVPMLSKPDVVIEVIRKAAATIAEKSGL
jgi:pimeloyl-ACP methyl ester carboxylesterase